MKKIYQEFMPIVNAIVNLHKKAAAMGVFTDHRSFAVCQECQLFEDVTIQGMLIVCRKKYQPEDTGLRFKELTDNAVECPSCKSIFCPYDPKNVVTEED